MCEVLSRTMWCPSIYRYSALKHEFDFDLYYLYYIYVIYIYYYCI